MTTHVFIVDEDTFRFHLEYMFAGTGANVLINYFNNSISSSSSLDKLYASMLADCSRVRKNDNVLFYLQSRNGKDGCFYGLFKIDSVPFIDKGGLNNQFLSAQGLKKYLPFRVLIRPYKVYPKGVTEWCALDDLTNVISPSNMIWSLIYRKLRGNRGNTMITMYESKRLLHLINLANSGAYLNSSGFSFDQATREIVSGPKYNYPASLAQHSTSILPQLIHKLATNKAHEAFLQAYIIGNLENDTSLLKALRITPASIKWLGNEMYCGVGMQKIDIVISTKEDEDEEILYVIELKDDYSSPSAYTQIEKYIKWVSQYYCGNTPCFIQPVLISKKPKRKRNSSTLTSINKAINLLNNSTPSFCKKVLTIEYELQGNSIYFK